MIYDGMDINQLEGIKNSLVHMIEVSVDRYYYLTNELKIVSDSMEKKRLETENKKV